MDNHKTGKHVLFVFIVFIASLVLAAAGGTFGFLLAFILFGDGSELYFWLQKTLQIEPYVFTAVTVSIIAFLFTWVMAFSLFKNRIFKL